jgi:nucleoside 2-deoxyribosyltransferase
MTVTRKDVKMAANEELKCFVLMPFRTEFDDVYDSIKLAVTSAAIGENLSCSRLDEVRSAGVITEDLLTEIRSAALCVADVTESNPNVMWEMGFAAALQKPTIAISQQGSRLPFDISNIRTLFYDRQKLAATLRASLTEATKETLTRYEVRRKGRSTRLPERTSLTVAVTGSMYVEPNRAARRLRTLLAPYMDANTTWYCGTFGTVDESAADLLFDAQQRVIPVGYGSYDVSENMLSILERNDATFVDATQEQLPRVEGAPSTRDVLFVSKADLVVVVWNGRSEGTRELLSWLQSQRKDHMIGFV